MHIIYTFPYRALSVERAPTRTLINYDHFGPVTAHNIYCLQIGLLQGALDGAGTDLLIIYTLQWAFTPRCSEFTISILALCTPPHGRSKTDAEPTVSG